MSDADIVKDLVASFNSMAVHAAGKCDKCGVRRYVRSNIPPTGLGNCIECGDPLVEFKTYTEEEAEELIPKLESEITSLRTELAAMRELADEARGLLDEFFRIYPGGISPLHEDFDSRVDDYLAKTRPIPTDTSKETGE